MQFFAKIKDRLVYVLCCCNKDEEPVRAIEIGHPTDFRRVDISIAGLCGEQEQALLRAKAEVDAQRIFAGLPTSPVPSPIPQQGAFASTTNVASTELSPLVYSPIPVSPSSFDKFMKHARRASQRFSGLVDLQHSPYEPVHAITTEDNRAIQMSSVDVSRRESYDSKAFEDKQVVVEWSGRDSVTLGGSDKDAGEKSGAVKV